MTELKTLRDFVPFNPKECNGVENLIKKETLKAEAIKWYHRSDDDKHKFIREFFNITEEDLK